MAANVIDDGTTSKIIVSSPGVPCGTIVNVLSIEIDAVFADGIIRFSISKSKS